MNAEKNTINLSFLVTNTRIDSVVDTRFGPFGAFILSSFPSQASLAVQSPHWSIHAIPLPISSLAHSILLDLPFSAMEWTAEGLLMR